MGFDGIDDFPFMLALAAFLTFFRNLLD